MTKLTSFNEFKPLALRTEAHIESVKTNKQLLISLLVANVAITEILDGVKKQVFYGNPKKLLEQKDTFIAALETALATLKDDVAPDSLEEFVDVNPRVFHGIVGLVTESGELSEALLNYVIDGELDPVNIQEEATGDQGWYRAILNDELGLDEYQGLTNVINKLSKRYPEKFTNELAANRDLVAERKELEVGHEVSGHPYVTKE